MHRNLTSIAGLLTLCGMAIGQTSVQQVAITTPAVVDPSDPEDLGSRPVEAAIGVNDEAVVVLSNMRMSIFARTGGNHLDTGFPDAMASDFPFKKVDTTFGRFFDPRTEYDKANDRLWMMYSEDNFKYGGGGALSRIHLAVSRAEPSGGLDSFDTDDWYYFTGIGGTAIDGEALNLGQPVDPQVDPEVSPFRSGQGHNPLVTLADLPAMSIDEQAVYLTPYSVEGTGPGAVFGTIVIIPIEHSNGSMLDGDRPSETDIIMMRRNLLNDPSGERNLPDDSLEAYAVQEPFDQFDNAQFFLSLPVDGEINEGLRLGGLWYDSTASQWKYRQRVNTSPGTTPTALDDMDLNPSPTTAAALRFYDTAGGYRPLTPDTDFRPAATSSFIASAVLVYDNSNAARIFAAHHVIPVDSSQNPEEREERYVVQWYVIDPDLTNLRNPSNKWDPQVVASGRIDAGSGDRYHAVIGVTPQGVAHLQYTYSDGSTFPQVQRAILDNTYTAVVSETVIQSKPSVVFDTTTGSFWADYADMQADPLYCGFWSAHTLAHDLDERDEWMFFQPLNCQDPELNFDGDVDLYDMALFTDFFNAGARRVDMNTDGETDATDAAIYQKAYNAQKD
ncbi:MAG: hypothetical protein ACIAS6_03435 [Phycisphaerales bacterium JB060]